MKNREQEIVRKSVLNMSFLVVLQIIIQIISFVLNMVVARYVSKEAFGYASIHLPTLSNFILFLLKDSFRRTAQKNFMKESIRELNLSKEFSSPQAYEKAKLTSSLNLVWIGIGFTSLLASSTVLLFFIYYSYTMALDELSDLQLGIMIYGGCAIIEALSEPFAIKYIIQMDFKVRVIAEAVAYLLRSSLIYLLIVFYEMDLMALILSQVLYVVTLLLTYLLLVCIYEHKKPPEDRFPISHFLPRKICTFPHTIGAEHERVVGDTLINEKGREFWIFDEQLVLIKNFSLYCFIKYILSEGEKLILISTEHLTTEEKAEYGLASNLGSLVPRFLFAPVEEAAFNLFSKYDQINNGSASAAAPNSEDVQNNRHEDADIIQNNREKSENELSILSRIISLLICVGLFAIVYGYHYSYAVITIMYGPKWSTQSCTNMLSRYCIYILIMGVNGITEAYVQAKATALHIKALQKLMLLNSIIFIALCYAFSGYGASGLIAANTLNMIYRIIISGYFINKMNKNSTPILQFINNCSPHANTWASFLLAATFACFFRWKFENTHMMYHLLIGFVLACGNIYYVFIQNAGVLRKLREHKHRRTE